MEMIIEKDYTKDKIMLLAIASTCLMGDIKYYEDVDTRRTMLFEKLSLFD